MKLGKVLQGIRAAGVTVGGPIVLIMAAAASIASAFRALVTRRRPAWPATVGLLSTAVYLLSVRRRMLGWGATAEEGRQALPGDHLAEAPERSITRALTIDAPVEEVWPWLAQIGQDRAGFYSYEWLENLAGCEMQNADRIHPEWQHRMVGEDVPLHPAGPFLKVRLFEPNRAIVLEGWGAFIVKPIDEGHTRLIARGHGKPGLANAGYAAFLEIPHFIMERKMMLGIKTRAERFGYAIVRAARHRPSETAPEREEQLAAST